MINFHKVLGEWQQFTFLHTNPRSFKRARVFLWQLYEHKHEWPWTDKRHEPANFVRIKKRFVATKSKNNVQRKLKNDGGRWSQKKVVLQALSRILLIFHQNGFCWTLFFYRLRDHPLGVLLNFGRLTPGGYRVRAPGLFLRPWSCPSLVQ